MKHILKYIVCTILVVVAAGTTWILAALAAGAAWISILTVSFWLWEKLA